MGHQVRVLVQRLVHIAAIALVAQCGVALAANDNGRWVVVPAASSPNPVWEH